MKEHSYTKAAGISLFVHAVLAGVLIIGYCLITPSSAATPIEVDFIIASVVDVGDSLNEVSSVSTADLQTKMAGQQTDSKENAEQPTTEPQKNSQQPEVSNQNSLPTTIRETATAGVRKGGGDVYETPDLSPTSNPRLRSQPRYISGPRPAYPQDARRAGQEGIVMIRVLVGTDGSAADVVVFTSSGYESLDQAAARAVKKWRFSPARNDSTAVESYYDVRIKFRLADWQ
ncbi:hypothetical protein SPFL3102_00068 [Sporomusaceae bacterium FL31]|nr:hypothetical protein SPFL3101_02479 [Sporomusaceae bacterium FL31]GCE32303.1 hypothetical protein SPFL3102_00068 [Sporomusaceae bacterium]